jgi:hypothetical protein
MNQPQPKHFESRDPIRKMPLRDPGQSVREEIIDLVIGGFGAWVITALMVIMLAILEWVRWAINAQHAPILMTVTAFMIVLIAVRKSQKVHAQIEQLRLGLKGERAVEQRLQADLLPLGYTIIHDICFDGFNIDHAIIGPGGVYAVEVKTRTKRKGGAEISYDGEQILVDGYSPDRDPVAQVQGNARWLEEILAEYTGRSIDVRPVVIFPGWFVERQPPGVHVWVLNENAFIKFVTNERIKLDQAEIRVLSEGLARYVRDQLERELS